MRRLVYFIAIVAGCGILEPDDTCACTTLMLTKPFSGEVRPVTPGPMSGIRVFTESARDVDATATTCTLPGQTIVRTETIASTDGQFSTIVQWPGTPACARIWAQNQSGSISSDTLVYPLDEATADVAVTGLILQLRASSP